MGPTLDQHAHVHPTVFRALMGNSSHFALFVRTLSTFIFLIAILTAMLSLKLLRLEPAALADDVRSLQQPQVLAQPSRLLLRNRPSSVSSLISAISSLVSFYNNKNNNNKEHKLEQARYHKSSILARPTLDFRKEKS